MKLNKFLAYRLEAVNGSLFIRFLTPIILIPFMMLIFPTSEKAELPPCSAARSYIIDPGFINFTSSSLNILGAGFQESKGIVAGSITDMKKLESSIRNCLASAEKMASIRVKDIILGFSSVSSSSEVFSIEIDLKGSIIGKADLEKSYEYLYNKLNLENRTILHVIPVQRPILQWHRL